MREFLASEAMDGLGIPTTRAAAIVTSSSRVARDPFYDGCVRQEPCAVVMRVAGTFLRCEAEEGGVHVVWEITTV